MGLYHFRIKMYHTTFSFFDSCVTLLLLKKNSSDEFFLRNTKFDLCRKLLNSKLVGEIILDHDILLFNECAIAYRFYLRDKVTSIQLPLSGALIKEIPDWKLLIKIRCYTFLRLKTGTAEQASPYMIERATFCNLSVIIA